MEKDALSTRLDELQAAAERARTAYQWQEAASYYTQALMLPDLPPEVEYRLLDGRAYAHQRTVNLTEQQRDLQRMLELAQKHEVRLWHMEALLRLAEVSQDNGELSLSREQAETALRMAQAESAPHYEGWAYYMLARIESTTGRYDQAMEPLNRALELFKADGDLAWESRVYRDLAFAGHRLGQNIIEAAECCMRPAQQLGDRLLEAQALHIMGIAHINEPATFRMYTEKSLEMYQSIRDKRGVATLSHNMGVYYRDFGLYKRSQSYLERAYQLYEGSGNLRQRTTTQFTLGFIAYLLGDLQKARSINEKVLEVFEEKGFRELEAFAIMTRGLIDQAEGNYAGAVKAMEYSLELMKDSQFFVATTSSILAHIHYHAGELKKALETAEESIRLAESIPENDTGLAWAVRAWAKQDLYGEAVQEETWQDVQFAYMMMMKPVQTLTDWGLRRSFLHRSPFNNEVVISWARMAAARGISLQFTGDQVPPDGQIHDPFKRLLDIGERMANQHDPEELLPFIVDEFFELSGAERVFIALLHEGESERPQLRLASGMAGSETEAVFDQAQDTISQALLARHAILVHNAGDVPPGDPPEIHQRSLLILPLVSQSHVLGVLYADIRTIFGAFTNQDTDLLSMFANQAASALESAELVRSLEQRVAERTHSLNERVAELQLINAVQAGLAAQLDFEGLIDLVGSRLEYYLKPDNLGIVFYDAESQTLRSAYYSVAGRRYPSETFPLGMGISSTVVKTRKPLMLLSLDEIEKHNPVIPSAASNETYSDHMSWLGVPLMREGEVMGVLFISRYLDNAFAETDLNLLETLAHSLSVALSNARSFEAERRRSAELTLINRIQEDLVANLDLNAIYQLIASEVPKIFDVRAYALVSYDRQHEQVQVHVSNFLDPQAPPSRFSKNSHRLIEKREVLYFPTRADVENQYRPDPEDRAELPDWVQSAITVPTVVDNQVTGAIVLLSEHPYAFSKSDIRLLTTITNTMSLALADALSFEAERQRNAELALINRIQEGLVARIKMEEIYKLVGEEVTKIFDLQGYIVVKYDHAQETMHINSASLEINNNTAHFSSYTRFLIDKKEVIYLKTRDEVMHAYRESNLIENVALPDWHSTLTVPMIVDGVVTGSILLWSNQPNAFSKSDIRLLTTITNSMSVALENARLFEEVERQKQYFEALVQNSPVAVVVIDDGGNVTSWNPSAERLFGYTQSEAIGTPMTDLVAHPADLHLESTRFVQLTGTEDPQSTSSGIFHAFTQRARKDGSLVDVEVLTVPIIVQGERVGIYAIYHDITDLQHARQAAIDASHAKSTFLANMSHELRTPLNAITGFTRIVRRKGKESLPPKQLENLDKVLVSADHLLNLINTILDIAKIEAGRMDVQHHAFSLPGLVEVVIGTAYPLVKPGVDLIADIQPGLNTIHSDPEKIKQILLNLVSNAAKFTHKGHISICGRAARDFIQICVEDTGIGIAPDALERIFDEFQQADSSTTRQYGGTGLGLSISKHLARLLGGDLTVASQLGVGSTFTLTIPYANPTLHGGEASPGAKDRLESMETMEPLVLVIDDDRNAHDLMCDTLCESGYRLVSAYSGEQGIQLAREMSPDAILLDIMMPHKDGWQTLHDLKTDDTTRNIPVILVTVTDNKPLGYRLGAADYLVKPLNESDVQAALQRLSLPQHTGQSVQPAENIAQPRRLLVVDDDPQAVELIAQLLQESDYTLFTAANGEQALREIEQHSPEVILLDLLMPDLDGFGVIEALQRKPETASIPVIVITAKTLTEAEAARLQQRTVSIIQKSSLQNGPQGDLLVQQIADALQTA